ncbi:MAG: helix-turn-helix domain-containing protein, partial [Candidatus Sumerlaeota bacterium]
NTMQRVMLMAQGNTITVNDLPATLKGEQQLATSSRNLQAGTEALEDLDLNSVLNTEDFEQPLADRLQLITDHIEKYLIRAALKKTKGHRQDTADLLGMSRKSLHNKMVRYGLFSEEE